jgi:putative NIF3 family GTP cyclohydrolase 1 type 2
MVRSCILGSLSLIAITTVGAQPGPASTPGRPTARQIVERIKDHTGGHDGEAWKGSTVDTFKAGDPDLPVTGVATTFSATMDVLKRAVARGMNLIVAHEPTFYNHLDEVIGLQTDPVYREKLAFIDQHHLVVWRFHDHWHSAPDQPDGVLKGMVAALRAEAFQSSTDPQEFKIPETRLDDLAAEIKLRLHIRTLRVVGDPALIVTGVAFRPGAYPGEKQMKALAPEGIQALVVGESREWETVLYAVDAMGQGRRKGLILIGHDVSEEQGMRECADWLRAFVSEVPVEHIPAGEPFWTPE